MANFTHVVSADEVVIRNNEIDVVFQAIAFVNVNIELGKVNTIVTIRNNNLNGGKVHSSNSNGIVEE